MVHREIRCGSSLFAGSFGRFYLADPHSQRPWRYSASLEYCLLLVTVTREYASYIRVKVDVFLAGLEDIGGNTLLQTSFRRANHFLAHRTLPPLTSSRKVKGCLCHWLALFPKRKSDVLGPDFGLIFPTIYWHLVGKHNAAANSVAYRGKIGILRAAQPANVTVLVAQSARIADLGHSVFMCTLAKNGLAQLISTLVCRGVQCSHTAETC